jgi:NitT/TauT family transport system substrate-binding protein
MIKRRVHKQGIVLGAGIALIAIGALIGSSMAHAKELEKLKFALNWTTPIASFMQFYAAEKQGFYKREGLDVEFVAIPGSGPTVSAVSSGEPLMGLAAGDPAMVAISKGAPIKAVWLQYQQNPTGVITFTKSGIKSFADLKGKTISTSASTPEGFALRARLRGTGLDPDKDVTVLSVAPGAKLSTMLVGRSDASTGFMNYQLILAQMKGHDVSFLPFATVERPMYQNAIFANTKLLAAKPDVVRRFLRASIDGLIWSRDNVDEAVKLVMTWDSTLKVNADFTKRDWTAQLPLYSSALTAKHGVGYMGDAGWKNVLDMLTEGTFIKGKLAPKDVYTNEFIPANAKKW